MKIVLTNDDGYDAPGLKALAEVAERLGRVVVVAGEAIVASHERLGDEGQTRYDWQHYIPLVQRKPGALRNGAPFADLPEPLQQLRRALLRCSRRKVATAPIMRRSARRRESRRRPPPPPDRRGRLGRGYAQIPRRHRGHVGHRR